MSCAPTSVASEADGFVSVRCRTAAVVCRLHCISLYAHTPPYTTGRRRRRRAQVALSCGAPIDVRRLECHRRGDTGPTLPVAAAISLSVIHGPIQAKLWPLKPLREARFFSIGRISDRRRRPCALKVKSLLSVLERSCSQEAEGNRT